MNKKEACYLLGVDMKGLADIVSIKYDSLRSLKSFAPIHLNLIQWELDKRFIKSMIGQADYLSVAAKAHLERISIIEESLNKNQEKINNELERAKDSGFDN